MLFDRTRKAGGGAGNLRSALPETFGVASLRAGDCAAKRPAGEEVHAPGVIPGGAASGRIGAPGRKAPIGERTKDIPAPVTHRAPHARRSAMENEETKESASAPFAEADPDAECMTDCCVCCCCDTEEECSMEA